MSFQAHLLRVFIASPSGVEVEINEIEEAIHQWNTLYSKELKVILLPVRWENIVSLWC